MPVRNGHARDQGGVDALLKHDMHHYRKALDKQRLVEKINKDRAIEHRLLWEKLKMINPNRTDEDLLSHAHRLEAQGLLAEAADAYQQLLIRPDQFHNQYLRDHLADLIKRVNRKQAEAKVLERQAQLEEEGRLWPGRPKGLESPRRISGVPRSDRPVGPMMPMSPDAYRAELAAQAMENRRRREAAKKQEELLEAKQVAVAAAMEALEQHQRKVVGGNHRLSIVNEMDLERASRQEERRRQFHQEWDHLKPAAGPGVRQSYDMEGRRREQIHNAHRDLVRQSYEPLVMHEEQAAACGNGGGGAFRDLYHQQPDGAAAVAGARQRPSSAGPAAAAAARERERERNNAAAFERQYVPEHPYAPPGGPPPPQEAWPAAPPAGAGGLRPGGAPYGLKGALKSPYARPGVDKPRVRIDPEVVRSHQQAFIDKHYKPAPIPPQMVPLRLRLEAARRPDPPVIAGAGGGGRGAGW